MIALWNGSNMTFGYFGILMLSLFGLGGAQINPCSPDEHSVIPNMGLRYVNYRISDLNAISGDSRLPAGWYRVGDDTMPESPPDDIFTCGTKFPIWLDGVHPTGSTIVDRSACQVDLTNNCEWAYSIQIKNCQTFFVYYLQSTASSNSGYCFGEGVKGTAPTFQVNQPSVQFELNRSRVGANDRPVSRLHFRCNFAPSPTEDLHYLVLWFGGGNKLYNAPLSQQSDDKALELDEQTFVDSGFKMGEDITCSVIAFYTPKGPPGPVSQFAPNTFVGIEVLTPSLTFENGEPDRDKRTIRVRPTVPLGCYGKSSCNVELFTYSPTNNPERVCDVITMENSVCGIKINSDTYDSVIELVVKTLESKEYRTEEGLYDIFLKTENTDENLIWRNYQLPRITVNVKPRTVVTYEGKMCYSYNDPHIKTFDGRSYDNHQPGVYTMYKHQVYDAEIQMKYSQCGGYRNGVPILCNCGFAARAGVTLYIIDVCDGKLDFNYKFCGDDALIVTRKGESIFTFTFIYGTYAVVTAYRRFITVNIYPSSNDVGNTRGLCGIMDSDCDNDFHYRHETEGPAADPDLKNGPCNGFDNYLDVFNNQPLRFIESWIVKQEKEDLFGSVITLDDLQPFETYKACVCSEPENKSGKLMNEIPCVKDSVTQCSPGREIVGTHSCAPPSQTRRSVRSPRNALNTPEVRSKDTFSRLKREVTEVKNFTEAEAEALCQEYMDSSGVFLLSGEVPNVRPQSSVENCVSDVMLTAETEWADVALEALQGACLEELQRNTTLRQKTSNNEMSLAERIEAIACSKNCSGVGTCDKGSCTCNSGWGGYDCSIDLTVGPMIQGLLEEVCDKQQQPACNHAYVFGQIFAKSPNLTCRLEEFSLSENGTRQPRGIHSFPGQFETMIEVICPLQSTRRRRAVPEDEFVLGYTISVSNDGDLYEAGTDLYIYDSECQNVQNISNEMQFSLKEDYCFIEGQCVYGGLRRSGSSCSYCNPSESTRTWSVDTQILECLPPSTSRPTYDSDGINQFMYLVIIAGVIAALVVLSICIVMICSRFRGSPGRVGLSSVSFGGAAKSTTSRTTTQM